MTRIPKINVGLFGLGTVGGSVFQILKDHEHFIAEKICYPIQITKICELDPKKKQQYELASSILTNKISDILDDPEISIVVELIGDKPIAKEIMLKALSLGKHVVTANKAILAHHGLELYSEAFKHEVDIYFEAAVAGSIPILRTLREGFVSDKIISVQGIINGTSNYILTKMAKEKADFKVALADAKKNGYAEADPTSDIEGIDAACKLSILATMAYGVFIPYDKIYRQGISEITPFDIEMAQKFGFSLKLLAISRKTNQEIDVRVHPTMIPATHLLAHVYGVLNAVMIEGEYMGPSVMMGKGAGGKPTATAVASDIIEIARNISRQVRGIPPLGFKAENIQKAKIKPIEEIESEYYLRFTAVDKPGVFAKIAHVLGHHEISIASVHQEGREEGHEVPIMVLTHRAKEKNVICALKEIDKLPTVAQKTLLIRIERS